MRKIRQSRTIARFFSLKTARKEMSFTEMEKIQGGADLEGEEIKVQL